ncbi:MAG: DNA polymerase III subunit [Deltaproteobacteria bacterium]|nr:DNA polymerase III subunit [Deltaproteobacteria bacterium]
MTLGRVLGQDAATATLRRALARGRLHHAYRFEGPEGVGKELAAVALAQALVCTAGGVEACGSCEACARAGRRSERAPEVPLHPDVVLVGRGLYPPELLGGKKESSEISVEQIRRVILARASYPPHEARHQVFIVRGAEELSMSAANALLKTLEEPRPHTQFILLTSQPEQLLDTIRSRTLPIRFGPLPDAVVAGLLRARGVPEERLAGLCELAGGSMARALALSDPEASAAREAFVRGVLEAMRAPGLGAAIAFAETGERDRASLVDGLRALAASFAVDARLQVASASSRALVAARRHELVEDAVASIERNGQGTLVLGALVASLKAGRQLRPHKPPGGPPPRR